MDKFWSQHFEKHWSQAHLRFWLLQGGLHCFDLLKMTRHICSHHHLNYQGPKLPFQNKEKEKKNEWVSLLLLIKVLLIFSLIFHF